MWYTNTGAKAAGQDQKTIPLWLESGFLTLERLTKKEGKERRGDSFFTP